MSTPQPAQATPSQAIEALAQMINDYLATLPQSARIPTAAHAQQCLACVQAGLATHKDAGAGALHADGAASPRGD